MINALFWFLHRITGIILIGGVAVHLLVMQYGVAFHYGEVIRTAFLLSAVYHASYGLWGLSVEYIRSAAVRRLSQGVIILLSVALTGMAV